MDARKDHATSMINYAANRACMQAIARCRHIYRNKYELAMRAMHPIVWNNQKENIPTSLIQAHGLTLSIDFVEGALRPTFYACLTDENNKEITRSNTYVDAH